MIRHASRSSIVNTPGPTVLSLIALSVSGSIARSEEMSAPSIFQTNAHEILHSLATRVIIGPPPFDSCDSFCCACRQRPCQVFSVGYGIWVSNLVDTTISIEGQTIQSQFFCQKILHCRPRCIRETKQQQHDTPP